MGTLKPPNLFGIVETGIFRSNAPLEENLPFLDHLNLRTVLFLSPEVLLRPVVEFFKDKGIRVLSLGLEAWRPEPNWTCLCDEFLKDALEMVVSAPRTPLRLSGSRSTRNDCHILSSIVTCDNRFVCCDCHSRPACPPLRSFPAAAHILLCVVLS